MNNTVRKRAAESIEKMEAPHVERLCFGVQVAVIQGGSVKRGLVTEYIPKSATVRVQIPHVLAGSCWPLISVEKVALWDEIVAYDDTMARTPVWRRDPLAFPMKYKPASEFVEEP